MDASSIQSRQPSTYREQFCTVCAALLALGGVMWGILCLIFLSRWSGILIFGPGYFVTAGYFYRGFGKPMLGWQLVIWGGSALVQGAWLVWFLKVSIPEDRFVPFFQMCELWWKFSFVVSIVCLIADGTARWPIRRVE